MTERRRPGRPATVSPELIPLLRGAATRPSSIELDPRAADQLDSMRGLAVAFIISAVMWYAVFRWLL